MTKGEGRSNHSITSGVGKMCRERSATEDQRLQEKAPNEPRKGSVICTFGRLERPIDSVILHLVGTKRKA